MTMIVENDLGDHLLDPTPDDDIAQDTFVDSLYTEETSEPHTVDPNIEDTSDPQGADAPQEGGVEFEDALSEYLASRGIKDGNTIVFDDGEGNTTEAKFSELSREEQLSILNELAKPNLTDSEIQAVQYLRDNNATLQDVINHFSKQAVEKYIASNAPQREYSVDEYSNDELYIADLRSKFPEMSDAELEADLTLAKSNEELFNKKVETIRTNYKQLEDQKIEEARAAEEQGYNEFKNALHTSLTNFEEISLDYTDPSSDSLTIEDSEKEAIYNYILNTDENGVSQFAKDMHDPSILVDLAWYRLFGKDAISGISQYWKGVVKETRKAEARAAKEHSKSQKTHVIPTKEDLGKKQDRTLTSL